MILWRDLGRFALFMAGGIAYDLIRRMLGFGGTTLTYTEQLIVVVGMVLLCAIREEK